jgi:tRNA A-37 threonylcarbamoyl transferase component Bud32
MRSGELYVLSRKINRNNKPRDVNAIIIGVYLKKFLSQIHALGLTHGDFTDTNILWHGGNAYVIDFESSVDQVDFPDDFIYFKMIDYADLAITLHKLNRNFYIEAEKIAQQIKEYEDYIMNDQLDKDKKSILEKLNNDMMEKINL